MRLQDKLNHLRQHKKGILAANFYNFETLNGILDASAELKMPVIIQLSENSIHYLGLNAAAKYARTALHERKIEGWLHLDHASSTEMVKKCLDAGFDSVMIDFSEKDYAANVKASKKAVKLAESYLATVESELAYNLEAGEKSDEDGFTKPEEARHFVEETGIHALAVAFGSLHGLYQKPTKLNFKRLNEIYDAVNVPLVLHGSTGINDKLMQEAIRHGITKVNLAAETKNAFMLALRDILKENHEIDLRRVFPVATTAVTELIKMKLLAIQEA